MPEQRADKQDDPPAENPPQEPAPDGEPTSIADAVAIEEGVPGTPREQRLVSKIEPIFDGGNLILYAIVGFLLFGLAIAALGYALFTIPKNLEQGVPYTLTSLLSELLLILILAEIIRTIVTFIATKTTSVRPFLTVALISSVRRILSVGAELSLEELEGDKFTRAMSELVVDGGLILIIALSLFLVSRREGG
jgi:uncharacterized membrane protein (DUF373 family)